MKRAFTLEDIKQSKVADLNGHLFPKREDKKKKKSKYGNSKVEVDGILFDSTKEAKRYGELKMMRKGGVISFLELQKEFELNDGGTHSYKYVADFCYTITDTGEKVIEDCKGALTVVFKKKQKLMKKLFGIIIKLT